MRLFDEDRVFWDRLLSMLSSHFGDQCEFVLHDFTNDYSKTIIDIRNGNITGRKVGDCGSNLGLEVMRGTNNEGDRHNYITHTPNGKILRSSTMYLHDDAGAVIGALCINLDITTTIAFEDFLHKYNDFTFDKETKNEVFASDVKSLLEHLIKEAQSKINKKVGDMDKRDKIEFLRHLDRKGAFLITKSSEKICEYLEISKFTLYNYLESVRADNSSDSHSQVESEANVS